MQRRPELREEPEEDYDSANSNLNEPGEPPPDLLSRQPNPNSIQNPHLKRYSCYSCEPPDCSKTTTCQNALQCWKSRVRESTGEESVSKGCTTDQEQLPFFCR